MNEPRCPDHIDGEHVFDEIGLCYGSVCKAQLVPAKTENLDNLLRTCIYGDFMGDAPDDLSMALNARSELAVMLAAAPLLRQEVERLEAANAELLAALETARDHIPMDSLEVSHSKDTQQIRAAINKHGGRA